LVRESIVIQNTGWKSSLVQKIKRMTILEKLIKVSPIR